MNRQNIIDMIAKVYGVVWTNEAQLKDLERFAALVASAERAFCHQLMLDFIEEFMGYEKDRHPMFSEGYDLALFHMKKLIEGDKHD